MFPSEANPATSSHHIEKFKISVFQVPEEVKIKPLLKFAG